MFSIFASFLRRGCQHHSSALRRFLGAGAASASSASTATAAKALPSPLEHHACFVLGDLNYRLTLPNLEVRWRVWCRDWRALLLHDELTCQLRSPGGGVAQLPAAAVSPGQDAGVVSSGPFGAFHEAEVNFKPTYQP